MSDPAPPGRPPNSTRARVLVPFAIITLIWGSTWIVIRNQLGVDAAGAVPVAPSWSVSYRFLVAGILLAVVARLRGERLPPGPAPIVFAALVGLFQFVGNFNFVYRAEAHITSGLVAVIFALLLVPNALLARAFLGQRMGRQLLLGSLIAVAGTALLVVQEARADANATREAILGAALTIGGVLCASVANVMMATRQAGRYPAVPMLATAMLVGAAADAGWALVTVGAPTFDPRPSYIAGILYLGVVASALAFVLYFGIIRAIGPAKAAYNSVVVPVIAMLLSTLIEGYRWSALSLGGAALVLAGLVVALTARRPQRSPAR